MARKAKPKQTQTIREFRKDLAILKRKGLTKVDVRKAQKTRYLSKLVRDNRDVISGKATVVKISGSNRRIASDIATRKPLSATRVASRLSGGRAKSGKVILPNTGTPIRYDKRNQRFTTTVERDGRKVKAIVAPTKETFTAMQAEGYKFRVHFSQGTFKDFDTVDRMIKDMEQYEIPHGHGKDGFTDWYSAVIATKR
jgi:hypothetical protein